MKGCFYAVQYMWQDRRKINDSALEALIRKPGVEIYVMYVKGCPGTEQINQVGNHCC